MIDEKHINDYLHFGYIPDFGKLEKISHILTLQKKETRLLADVSEEQLVEKGIAILNDVFDELLANQTEKKHLIPLSGGLDSRLILGALLKRVNPQNIFTVTFGSPRSFDYDIPKKVVKNTGVNFERIDCNKLDYSMENLTGAALNGGAWTSTPDMYINRLSLKLDSNFIRWSGFIGDFVAGSYVGRGSNSGNNQELFVQNERRSKEIKLTHPDYNPVNSLLQNTELYSPVLNEYENIALLNRYASGIIPILFPENSTIISPLNHPSWVDFMFNLPTKYRERSYLFKKILIRMYPDLMSRPCKNNLGLGLNKNNSFTKFLNHTKLKLKYEVSKSLNSVYFPPIGVNYLFYKEAIKVNPSIRESMVETCESLEKRKVVEWLSPNQILNEHLENRKDYSQSLLMLLGLEVNLRAGEENS